MEKYGVLVGQTHLFKEASKKGQPVCPSCGAKIHLHGSIPQCPNCGTEPYEVKDAERKEKKPARDSADKGKPEEAKEI
jgi:predicted RNA-binding Zn-ribbon protein involved in translation (DUF1610 family)